MASKRIAPILAAAILLLGAWPVALAAQNIAGSGDYSFALAADGQPVYTQVLRWRAEGNIFEFGFTLRRISDGAAPAEIRRERLSETEIALHLDPGDYDYRVVAYNLLGQAEDTTDWIAFRVLKAEIPLIREVSPAILLMDDAPDRRVTVRGEKLMPGCRIRLQSGAVALEGKELARSGDGEVVLVFPDEAYSGGLFDLSVENPGGLAARSRAAIDIRSALPAPTLILPTAGFAFGPAELRSRRAIDLEWAAVPGATEYRLAVFAPGRAEALYVREGLAGTSWVIDDLPSLQRGSYAWRVVASAHGPDGAIERLGLTAASGFAVQLPPLAATHLVPGTDYYALDPTSPIEAAAALIPRPAAPGADCSYELAAGTPPVFTQILGWRADPNAFDFAFSLRRRTAGAESEPLLDERTDADFLALRLEPGDYDCRISAFNLLGQVEQTTAWVPFTVRAAVIPAIEAVSPAVLFMDDAPDRRIVVRGQRLLPGGRILLRPSGAGPDAAEFLGALVERSGDGDMVATFPEEVYAGGVFDLAYENPGRLMAVKPAALDVRAALPAPVISAPVAGFVFGPAELKARRTIDLEWLPVEGASDYRLAVYAAGSAEPLLVREDLRDARCVIEDLSAFGRGEYSWKVVAFAHDASGGLARLGLSAESDFAITLPTLTTAVPKTDGVYFGY